jgi:elongation factor Ts
MATLNEIKELRNITGAGINAVREALDASNGDFNEAVKYLRVKGMAKAEKRKGKIAKDGILGTYVHSNNKMVVVVQVACETDFAAKSSDMVKFANDLALHIAATNPKYIDVASIDSKTMENERSIAEEGLDGKPEAIKTSIIEGKLEKFYKENVLIKQSFFVDENKTVEDVLNEMVAKIGEKIEISYFYKFALGEDVVESSAKIEDGISAEDHD